MFFQVISHNTSDQKFLRLLPSSRNEVFYSFIYVVFNYVVSNKNYVYVAVSDVISEYE